MFADTLLNKHYNDGNDKAFLSRLLTLGRSEKDIEKACKILISPVTDDCYEYANELLLERLEERAGVLYIAQNEHFPGVYKLGRSKCSRERAKTLNAAGVIGKIKMQWDCFAIDAVLSESLWHRSLADNHHEKEFYNVEMALAVTKATEAIEEINQLYLRVARCFMRDNT